MKNDKVKIVLERKEAEWKDVWIMEGQVKERCMEVYKKEKGTGKIVLIIE